MPRFVEIADVDHVYIWMVKVLLYELLLRLAGLVPETRTLLCHTSISTLNRQLLCLVAASLWHYRDYGTTMVRHQFHLALDEHNRNKFIASQIQDGKLQLMAMDFMLR